MMVCMHKSQCFERERRMDIDDVITTSSGVKKQVAYFYDAEVGNYHYGQGHPMKVSEDFDD